MGEFPLERGDVARHRLLPDEEALGGPREVELLGDGDERAELAQVRHRGRPVAVVVESRGTGVGELAGLRPW